MNVRKATLKDEAQILALLKQLLASSGEASESWDGEPETIRAILEDPELGSILVAEEDGEVAGLTTLSFPFAIRCNGRYTCIEENIVDAKHRGKGVGSKLLKAAIAEAVAQGCDELQVNNPSEMGYPLYIRHDIKDNGKSLRIKLSSGESASNS
jgi:GNAT superfamily N-acetyltransferase